MSKTRKLELKKISLFLVELNHSSKSAELRSIETLSYEVGPSVSVKVALTQNRNLTKVAHFLYLYFRNENKN